MTPDGVTAVAVPAVPPTAWCGLLFALAYGITSLVIGVEYMGAPCETDLSMWNIVAGTMMLVSVLLQINAMALGGSILVISRGDRTCSQVVSLIVTGAIGLFSFAWMIVGYVYTYGIDYDTHYCPALLFGWSFWTLTLFLSLIGVTVIIIICVLAFGGFSR